MPAGAEPPADDPLLPYCLWTVADSVPARVVGPGIATPCMGIVLADPALALDGVPEVEVPSLAVLGEINERAYGDAGVFGPLVRALRDDRVRTYGLRDRGEFVCVALTLAVGDDVSIQYVATEASHRRRGLASRLLLAVLAAARDAGMLTATLQASPDGLSVYKRLGFRSVAMLRGFVRPDSVGRLSQKARPHRLNTRTSMPDRGRVRTHNTAFLLDADRTWLGIHQLPGISTNPLRPVCGWASPDR